LQAPNQTNHRRYGERIVSAVSVGFFFILIGVIFLTTPNLFSRIIDFLQNFELVKVPNTVILLPAPRFPWAHSVVYSAWTQFSFVWSIFQAVILVLRFVVRSPLGKKAETVSNLVFWWGTSLLMRTFLHRAVTTTTWFVFWAGVLMICGLSLILRALIQQFG
jgi:hypothetical protein